MRAGRIGIAVGMVVFLAAMGSGASYAVWSTGASTSATVKAATVAITVDGSAASTALSVTHQPGQSYTSAVTLTNGGSVAFTYNIAVAPDGGASHSSISIALWKVGSTCDATSAVPAGAWTGTLAGLTAHGSEALALPGSQVLCVRTSLLGSATFAQNGNTASAKLTFTATNGWTDEKSFKINPSIDGVPVPNAQFPTSGFCSMSSSDKDMTLNWLSAGPGFTYQLEFWPAAAIPVIKTVNGTSATFDATAFTHRPGDGTVKLQTVAPDGSLSSGTVLTILLQNIGNSQKLACPTAP